MIFGLSSLDLMILALVLGLLFSLKTNSKVLFKPKNKLNLIYYLIVWASLAVAYVIAHLNPDQESINAMLIFYGVTVVGIQQLVISQIKNEDCEHSLESTLEDNKKFRKLCDRIPCSLDSQDSNEFQKYEKSFTDILNDYQRFKKLLDIMPQQDWNAFEKKSSMTDEDIIDHFKGKTDNYVGLGLLTSHEQKAYMFIIKTCLQYK